MQKDLLDCEFCGNCRNLRREIPDSEWLEEMGEMIAAAVETMGKAPRPFGSWQGGRPAEAEDALCSQPTKQLKSLPTGTVTTLGDIKEKL